MTVPESCASEPGVENVKVDGAPTVVQSSIAEAGLWLASEPEAWLTARATCASVAETGPSATVVERPEPTAANHRRDSPVPVAERSSSARSPPTATPNPETPIVAFKPSTVRSMRSALVSPSVPEVTRLCSAEKEVADPASRPASSIEVTAPCSSVTAPVKASKPVGRPEVSAVAQSSASEPPVLTSTEIPESVALATEPAASDPLRPVPTRPTQYRVSAVATGTSSPRVIDPPEISTPTVELPTESCSDLAMVPIVIGRASSRPTHRRRPSRHCSRR